MTACVRCGHDPEAEVLASWSLSVPMQIVSGNRHVYNVGGSRFAYAKSRNAWQFAIRVIARRCGATKATGRRRVTVTRVYSGRQRELDFDNLATGAKPVLDALVREGLLVDDDRAHAEVSYRQRKDLASWTFIAIEELAS